MIAYRTKEWYRSRIGKFTASNFPELMAQPSDKNASISKSALNCIEKAAAQLYFDKYHERPDSEPTRWGINNEKKALEVFSQITGLTTQDIGYMQHPLISSVGATPDARVLDIRNLEDLVIAQVKCPFRRSYHQDYTKSIVDNDSLFKKKSAFYWQMQGEMWVTGAAYNFFISFDPRENDISKQIHFVRIQRDEKAINELSKVIHHSILLRDQLLNDFRSGLKKPRNLADYY